MEREKFEKLINEFQELDKKVTKLKEFILNKDEFEKLDMINRDLLVAQFKAMETYLSILSIRLGINSYIVNEDSQETEESSNNE